MEYKIENIKIDKFILLNPSNNINKYDLKIFFKEITKLNNKNLNCFSLVCLTKNENKLENMYCIEKSYNQKYTLFFINNITKGWDSFNYINTNNDLILNYLKFNLIKGE